MKKKILFLSLYLSLPSVLHCDVWEDISKALKIGADALNLYNQIQNIKAQQAMIQQIENLKPAPGSTYSQRQEEWNRWNGLVSLLNEKQKQAVLQFNLLSDKELLHLWIASRKSTATFPSEFLMPSKYDSVSKAVWDFLINDDSDIDFYIEYLKGLNCEERIQFWKNTNFMKRSKVDYAFSKKEEKLKLDRQNFILKYNLEYQKCTGAEDSYNYYLIGSRDFSKNYYAFLKMDKNERRSKWQALDTKSRNQIRKELENLRYNNSEPMREDEYTLFLNFVKDTWDEKTVQRLYRKYRPNNGDYLKQNSFKPYPKREMDVQTSERRR